MLAMDRYPHHRKHYRLTFPQAERPRFQLDDGSRHPVIDCSEGGLRFQLVGLSMPDVGTEISGALCFRGGRKIGVVGTVVRLADDEVALELGEEGISFAALWAEARRLRRRAAPADARVVI